MPIDEVKKTFAGIDDILKAYPKAAECLKKVSYDDKEKWDYGSYEWQTSKISICKKGIGDMGGGAHEAYHALDAAMSIDMDVTNGHAFSESIVKQALKNLGLRANSRDAADLNVKTIGFGNKDVDKIYEVYAYGLEKEYMGTHQNKLTTEMQNVLKRRYEE